ncbi:Carbohydrate-binding-like fold [Abeliophyllum distichum]|uniref:Carbohydrate-binding-like fold n=1 Tax=Abeliophyllum distichum TaxID=126358 RepID=A0ABD1RBE9_9LAMI
MVSVNYYSFAAFFIIILTCNFPLAIADSIQGCGGFVEASSALIKSRKSTDAKLDYSHITVELRTLDGLVKDSTQCAPNGYYFIPVYDKGSFVIKIKGPEGWSWDPEQVPVVVDHTGCNANEDINFRFTGFTTSGRVVGAVGGDSCSHKNGGPSNVNVELLSPSGDVVSSILTTSTGSYSFTNIIPGNYKIRASHSDLKIEVKGSTEVELGFENGVVQDIFFVSGYDIRGFVVAQGNPILGVHIYLYSEDVLEVDCPHDSGNAPGLGKALCHAVSDADGMFKFKSIPCGIYKLVPFYKGDNTVFDVSPPSMLVSLSHDHAIVPQKFQVTGFSVGGRVIDGNGDGVDVAQIVVDGHERSKTDKEGYYKLDQVTSKRYRIEAKKKHYKFEILNDFLVLPNMASISDIKAVSYDICGMVQTVSNDYRAKVALTHGPENVKPQVKQTDKNGKFCFEVPPGEYRLSAFPATPDTAPELLFSPPHIDVMVNSPLLGVKFYQAQVDIHGSVVCKEKCGSSVSVKLLGLDGKSKEEMTISLTEQSSEFSFSNVLPGKYRIEVKSYSPVAMSGDDIWCWEQSAIDMDVGADNVEGINFVQKGYWVSVISSHDVDAYLNQPGGSRVNLKIKKGTERTCLESPGVHELHFVDSCISFGSSFLRIDTSNPLPIYLKGEKYLLSGHISIDTNSFIGDENLPDNIPVDMLDNEGTVLDGTIARLVSSGIDQSTAAIYKYSVWTNFGEKLIFVPRDTRNDGGKKILFYPRQQHVSVTQDGCQAPISPFSGRLGLYIEGSVSPPLSDVHIRVIADGESHNASLKQGDLALETSTGTDGLFVAGPLYDDITYTIKASKPGYHVKPVGPHSFSCQKFSRISVQIYSKEDPDEPFPSVLLSLSGEDGYRNNSVTGVGGLYTFDNLFPGSFYLRPLLKEYAFSPPAQAIELGSGESRDIIFHATRVAYSAIGRVTILSGQPVEGISVEARADSKGFYEESVTDSSGSYRLRGLQPDTTYVIKVARKGELDRTRIERASPEYVTVKVAYEDIKGLEFLVFELPETTIVSGYVEGKKIKELNSHIRVEIRLASDPSKIESIFPLPMSNFFQVKDLPKSKHLLQLKSAIASSTHKFESEVIEVDLERHPQVHVGPLSYRIEEDIHKQELTPAPVYPLVVGVSVITLFICMPRLKDLYQAAMGSVSGSSTTAKKDVRKLVVRKKTY